MLLNTRNLRFPLFSISYMRNARVEINRDSDGLLCMKLFFYFREIIARLLSLLFSLKKDNYILFLFPLNLKKYMTYM